ncbi:MAG: GGDEF domain-containing protein, partial [Deltaproteobacteria bacterium]|nr:GGDEF domain-containing protein [Deltaproteobacteria bacterium]
PLPANLEPFLRVFPFAVVIIGLLLGWRFNRTRLIYAISLMLLTELGLSYFSSGLTGQLVFQSAALLLPLNLLWVSWFRERGIINLRALFWLTLLIVELVSWAGLIHFRPMLSEFWLNYSLIDLPQLQGLPLSQPLMLVNGLVMMLFIIRALFNLAAFEASFFWAQIMILAGFSGLGSQPLRLFLAGAGLILILGILESSHSLAYRDELTGLLGRRALNEALDKLGNRYTLAMLDIDHFKKFNDTHGHDVGDQVLRMVAGKLTAASGGGKLFRYGGEEFAVILPRKQIEDAIPYLEQMRQAVESARFVPRGKDRPQKKPKKRYLARLSLKKPLKVTISIGVATRNEQLLNPAAVIKAADQALYRAKKAGRNKVCG